MTIRQGNFRDNGDERYYLGYDGYGSNIDPRDALVMLQQQHTETVEHHAKLSAASLLEIAISLREMAITSRLKLEVDERPLEAARQRDSSNLAESGDLGPLRCRALAPAPEHMPGMYWYRDNPLAHVWR